VFVIFKGQYIR